METWSTADLLSERTRIRSLLDKAPPDRSTDLASLIHARRDVEAKVSDQRQSVTALERRKRPRKERRLPDVDLTTSKHNLAHFEQRAERLDREIAALHASQHRRASHLAAHSADRAELDELGHVLNERLRVQTNRIVRDPPSYVTRTLGPRPTNQAKDRAWVQAVVEIEKHRLEHNVTDGRTSTGAEPAALDRDAVNAWHRVRYTIEDTREIIAPATRAIDRPSPTLPAPSLDIGL